ncbi:uncharacterized protein PAC_14640 [Phialocephala subalpina]|uniref:DUF6594 domain-containing protein n=1 Tax=Phialocephala subalpina TaxID=576137 RepID=A0A1L7XI83_9HELO|nr:uncharacterized protein PAC_14640 [Phialocephala subalpina]
MTNQLSNTDIELVSGGDLSDTFSKRRRGFLRNLLPRHGILSGQSPRHNKDGELQRFQNPVEDYPKGYPRLSALMASHDSFQVFRRFSNLRTRLLLLSQDRVALLEKKLDNIDRDEGSPLFLGSSRRDKNEERQSVISDIRDALGTYDDLLERNSRMLAFGAAHPRDVSSLQNWHMGNACISREEMEFLDRREGLLCLSQPNDGLVSWLERFVSQRLMHLIKVGHY